MTRRNILRTTNIALLDDNLKVALGIEDDIANAAPLGEGGKASRDEPTIEKSLSELEDKSERDWSLGGWWVCRVIGMPCYGKVLADKRDFEVHLCQIKHCEYEARLAAEFVSVAPAPSGAITPSPPQPPAPVAPASEMANQVELMDVDEEIPAERVNTTHSRLVSFILMLKPRHEAYKLGLRKGLQRSVDDQVKVAAVAARQHLSGHFYDHLPNFQLDWSLEGRYVCRVVGMPRFGQISVRSGQCKSHLRAKKNLDHDARIGTELALVAPAVEVADQIEPMDVEEEIPAERAMNTTHSATGEGEEGRSLTNAIKRPKYALDAEIPDSEEERLGAEPVSKRTRAGARRAV
ncbi:hypothetical protein NW762_010041 [Fusarium torreyae]|uniref:Uncharacterized protein n=1 Tax=Fusarium torreyae TaxID=1237075 RepID=A0A9W8VAR6_9HYPO|nr:hypothetical protein NW762_010041 [Fusarium torreyae]